MSVPDEVYGLKAEIQVRTILAHAWAGFSHDRVYKGEFTIPQKWERELAGLAAMLEGADHVLSRVQDGLEVYAANYGAYMTEEQMPAEIEMLDVVLECDPQNVGLADRIARLALALGGCQGGRCADPFAAADAACCATWAWRCASCTAISGTAPNTGRGSATWKRPARRLIETGMRWFAAGTWKGIDDERARELYRQAFELDPSNPYPLGISGPRDRSARRVAGRLHEAAHRPGHPALPRPGRRAHGTCRGPSTTWARSTCSWAGPTTASRPTRRRSSSAPTTG